MKTGLARAPNRGPRNGRFIARRDINGQRSVDNECLFIKIFFFCNGRNELKRHRSLSFIHSDQIGMRDLSSIFFGNCLYFLFRSRFPSSLFQVYKSLIFDLFLVRYSNEIALERICIYPGNIQKQSEDFYFKIFFAGGLLAYFVRSKCLRHHMHGRSIFQRNGLHFMRSRIVSAVSR